MLRTNVEHLYGCNVYNEAAAMLLLCVKTVSWVGLFCADSPPVSKSLSASAAVDQYIDDVCDVFFRGVHVLTDALRAGFLALAVYQL